jgi:hypothetical protein
VGTDVAGAVQVSNDIASAVGTEPARTKATQPVQEEPAATARGPQEEQAEEGGKRGKSREEDGGKADCEEVAV